MKKTMLGFFMLMGGYSLLLSVDATTAFGVSLAVTGGYFLMASQDTK